jgi:hypothetical protein
MNQLQSFSTETGRPLTRNLLNKRFIVKLLLTNSFYSPLNAKLFISLTIPAIITPSSLQVASFITT